MKRKGKGIFWGDGLLAFFYFLHFLILTVHVVPMLLSRDKFAEFSKLPIADARTHTLALYCFDVESREAVDEVSAAALASGGTEVDGAEDLGFMYSRSFYDLDGHGQDVRIGSSVGISVFPDDGADAGTLVKAADSAMYHAKQEGNTFRFCKA